MVDNSIFNTKFVCCLILLSHTFILQITLRSENRVRTIVLLLRYESSFFNMIVCHKFEATPLERSANIVVVAAAYIAGVHSRNLGVH